MIGPILTFLAIVILLILITAPFEALEWWADWFEDDPELAHILPPSPTTTSDASCYIVYLTGIGSMEPETHAWREQQLFKRLRRELPDAVLITDIFPYSMNNVALTGHRLFSWLWRYAGRAKLGKNRLSIAGYLINVRNLAQVIVSLDHRYGPIYNRGSADLVRRALAHHGYPFDGELPVYLIGYSGGGQIATGAVPYLKLWLSAPVYVISLGGVFASNRGHLQATGYYHIVGRGDRVEKLCRIFFTRRWPIWRTSPWNRALAGGKAKVISTRAQAHLGRRSYIDGKRGPQPGTSYLDETVAIITDLIDKHSHPVAAEHNENG